MVIDMSKFIHRFVEEAREHLQQLNDGLCLLVQGQESSELIHRLFRSAHTIKGSSRMLKLMPIHHTAHQLEELLSQLRDGSVAWHEDVSRHLYAQIDAIAQMVDQLAATGDPLSIIPMDTPTMAEIPSCAPQITQPPAPQSVSQSVPNLPVAESDVPTLKSAETVRVRLEKIDHLLGLMGEMLASHGRLRHSLKDLEQLGRQLFLSPADQQMLQGFRASFKSVVQQQDMQMTELLDSALMMRMLPLAIVFEPASRLVRELGQSIGKQMLCVVKGAEIELDRHLIDKLSDPMVHLIRNAIDHGIEHTKERLAKGKSAQGRISLSARQDAGWVVIDIEDDGAGIDLSSVLEKAIRKGITSSEQASILSEQEIIDFIFLPGFSTSAIITDLSGRGVGMDVVKTTIVDELHGSITVETSPNKGTCFSLRLPLSLAVMRVLLVRVADYMWGFTAQYVAQLLHLSADQLLWIADRRVMILHNEFIPVVSLAGLLGLASRTADDDYPILMLVVKVRHEKLALIIDQLEDERDMLIKPLPPHLRTNQRVSGMVVLGDQSLVSVLHAPALLSLAKMQRQQGQKQVKTGQMPATVRQWHILVVDDSLNTREIEKDVLEAYGYQVTLAEDGLDGLMKARDGQFDAILTDVEMPNMDGFTLTAQLRQLDKYRHTPIMMITSREKEEDKRRGIQVGADAYIVKSDFEQNNLVSTLQALLGA